ncbi:MAG: hypothetical protein RLZZ500_1795 [Bacteroidota bacterium]|jgi:hypothetical protein
MYIFRIEKYEPNHRHSMNFFKKLFGSKSTTNDQTVNDKLNSLAAIYREDYFASRFVEESLADQPEIVEGCIKMVESYFIDNKIEAQIQTPIHHPINLDQVVTDGIGFHLYCKAFQQEDNQIVFTLAYAFAAYMTQELDFKLYRDKEPEYPLRGMTIKYVKNEGVLSLYPVEYALKVLNNEATFASLLDKIQNARTQMPTRDELFDSLK